MRWIIRYRNVKKIEKAVQAFRPSTRRRFYTAIEAMKIEGPAPKGWNAKKMEGSDHWRLKIDRKNRVEYEVFDKVLVITIVKVGLREGFYK